MKKMLFLLLFLTMSLFGAEKLLFQADPIKAFEQAKSQNKKVVMFIYSTTCGWCAKMKNTTFTNEKLIKLLNQKYVFSPINQDAGVLPERLLPEYVPMTYIIDAQSNKIIKTIPGFVDADEFISEIIAK